MPSSGSGTGTPVVDPIVDLTDLTVTVYSAVSLSRYVEITNVSECSFWGVSNENDPETACRRIWTKDQRDSLEFFLQDAQHQIEGLVGYPLTPQWINERIPYKNPILSEEGYVIEAGIKAESVISDGAAVSHASDPASLTIPTTLTSTDGIRIFYPENVDIEITPSRLYIDSGFLFVEIPRCRLVKYSLRDNPDIGLLYSDLNNFQTTVVVKRFYTDTTTQASLIWPHGCSSRCTDTGVCTSHTETACEIVENPKIGRIALRPANYSAGDWVNITNICCGGKPSSVILNYLAGLQKIPKTLETAVIRLAHANMPEEPCGCDVIHRLWSRDILVPDVLTAERLNCPFGLSNGAWSAWQAASNEALLRMGVFAGDRRRI